MLFQELERRLDRRIQASDFSIGSETTRCLRTFANLKISWPYRRRNAPGICNYFFEDGQYTRPELGPPPGNAVTSPFDTIFEELDSGFTSRSERKQAEQILESLFKRMIQALVESSRLETAPTLEPTPR